MEEMSYRFSIIIPVLNEADHINSQIEHIYNLSPSQDFEIVVVDGSQRKDTINAIKNPEVISIGSEKGRAHQMNAGADVARGDILLFLHADTRLPDGALEKISSVLDDRLYVGGAFDLCIRSERPVYNMISKMISLRSRLTRVPYGDQAIFLRRGYFNELGGYRKIPLMEDVELMRRIKRSKGRINFISDCVSTSQRRWEEEGIIYCTLRNWMVRALFYCGVSPGKLVRFYGYD
ncbi:MAG: TIGR04283 family arsenosugar biosynthesis glycosyltransferase [Halobacteriota archaeon]|nr:TIGR04283 family arsenosugar biosynthesis glycosyltransferase [Halobacteriota archaeon]